MSLDHAASPARPPRPARAPALLILPLALALAGCASCAGGPEPRRERQERLEREARELVQREASAELVRFASADELREYARRLGQAQRLRRMAAAENATAGSAPPPSVSPAAAEAAEAPGGESITNNQVAGVDEGGIVKVHGEHLVVLRRGRLFTVRVGDERLTPVARIDAYPAGAAGGWYDEMLVHGDTVIVVGYNYQEGGTELGRFAIDREGRLRHLGTHYLRSNDYYSSRNYASRLLGDRLVFYMPYYLLGAGEAGYTLPAVRTRGAGDWSEVIRASEIYRPIQPSSWPALHTVVTCDLSQPTFACTAQGIIGPAGRSFFVSGAAVYVWVGGEGGGEPSADRAAMPGAVVYRLPFDGSAPGAVRVAGMPTDQLSFEERDGHLDVLVRAEALGDWMWAPEVSSGDIALVRLPLAMFSDGLTSAPASAYVSLPRLSGDAWAFQNRFANGHVLYGAGGGWQQANRATVGQVIVHAVDRGATTAIGLPHVVDRIEVMGNDAVVVGAGGGELHFSAIGLEATPSVVGHYAQPGASQGETRTHGFFYRPESEREGMLGLPIRGGADAGWHQLVEGSAGVLFLRVTDRRFTPLGQLASGTAQVDDQCQASCVDWYGNARPIFLRGRMFALLGYELVEGRLDAGTIQEVGRTNFFRDMR
ncbi:MAG: beta-propeller domain-containing protein [Sandaracinaceae bacterium]|nr:beta-propeller domain-containing protein [Sandaracinaceae bacterium]